MATKLARLAASIPGAPGRWIIRQWLIVRDEEVSKALAENKRLLRKFVAKDVQLHNERAAHDFELRELRQMVGVLEDRLRDLDPDSRKYVKDLRVRRAQIMELNKAMKNA